ncbi:ATP-binding cassette domain-containing protein [Mesorhizobium sp. M0119]|uniref:ATP-binding cassette domain-containing protein n=1 Tax=Mesorhizobium sp. M0119 TaxID=2956885 RepID=UPI003338FF72
METVIKLSDGSSVRARRYIPIGKNDFVRFDNNGELEVFVKNDQTFIPSTPWRLEKEFKIAGRNIDITFKEIETNEELEKYEGLKRFHYRGGGGAGRVVPLIARSDLWDLPEVLGFIEITSSMIANTARRDFFNAPYQEPGGLAWTTWNRGASIKYSNIIARISRVVVHPEIRGLGLSKLFLAAALNYTALRWHYGGYRARFLEITAEMLRYYPFVSGEDFVFAGNTEGNEHRLDKDMKYLVRKALSPEGIMPQGGGGVMTMQRGYAEKVLQFMKKSGTPLAAILDNLRHDPGVLDQVTWEALYRVSRRPKPTYVAGLNAVARTYVRNRAALQAKPGVRTKLPESPRVWRISKLRAEAYADISQSSNARALQDTFGFVGKRLSTKVSSDFSIDLRSGEITLICGASGSGKSLFLSAIYSICRDSGASDDLRSASTTEGLELLYSGQVDGSPLIQNLAEIDRKRTAISYLGKTSLKEFLDVNASAGLAEPQLFVRPIASLSVGQAYRLQLALSFLTVPNILIVDNFCETLDRYNVLAVCRGLQRLAKRYNVAVVVASAAYERLLAVLSPNQVVLLRRGDEPKLLDQSSNDEITRLSQGLY